MAHAGAVTPAGEPRMNNGNGMSEILMSRLVANAFTMRNRMLDRMMGSLDPRRNYDDECGYPHDNPGPATYQELYDREPIASRVVDVYPRETWIAAPQVYEVEDTDVETPFETAWNELDRALRGGSLYQCEEGSPVWEYLSRADILSGIGHYGVVLLGLSGSDGLEAPAFTPGKAQAARQLLFMRVFPESMAAVSKYDTNPGSPRFGLPEAYNLTFANPSSSGATGGQQQTVHWTRILHIADNLGSSEVFGTPRMQPVLNRLLDLRKVYGGDAEGYWKSCILRIFFESKEGDVDLDIESLKEAFEQSENGTQRMMALLGMSAKTIAPSMTDPTAHISIQLDAICIKLGIPKRVFMGSERGELASTQDSQAWNDRIRARQHGYVTPRIIVPFVDRLIALGVLPAPSEGYSVYWPGLDALSEEEKAKIAKTRMEALGLYVEKNVESVVPLGDALTKVIGFTEDEAESMVEQSLDRMAEEETRAAEVEEEVNARLADERAIQGVAGVVG
jgi:hypothetical protein